MLLGLLRTGVRVSKDSKLIEIDPVNNKAICNFLADKIMTVAEGVLKAIILRVNVGYVVFGGKGC